MAQQLRTLTTLQEDPNSVLPVTPASADHTPSSGLFQHPHIYGIHSHKHVYVYIQIK